MPFIKNPFSHRRRQNRQQQGSSSTNLQVQPSGLLQAPARNSRESQRTVAVSIGGSRASLSSARTWGANTFEYWHPARVVSEAITHGEMAGSISSLSMTAAIPHGATPPFVHTNDVATYWARFDEGFRNGQRGRDVPEHTGTQQPAILVSRRSTSQTRAGTAGQQRAPGSRSSSTHSNTRRSAT